MPQPNTNAIDSIKRIADARGKIIDDSFPVFRHKIDSATKKIQQDSVLLAVADARIVNLKGLIGDQVQQFLSYQAAHNDSAALRVCAELVQTLKDSSALIALYRDRIAELVQDQFSISYTKDTVIGHLQNDLIFFRWAYRSCDSLQHLPKPKGPWVTGYASMNVNAGGGGLFSGVGPDITLVFRNGLYTKIGERFGTGGNRIEVGIGTKFSFHKK